MSKFYILVNYMPNFKMCKLGLMTKYGQKKNIFFPKFYQKILN